MYAVGIALLLVALLIVTVSVWAVRGRHPKPDPIVLDRSEIDARVGRAALHAQPPIVAREAPTELVEPPAPASGDSTFRVRPGSPSSDDPWNPFAADRARVNRIRAVRAEATARVRQRSRSAQEYESRDTHYALLGVEPSASIREIERAYRRLAAGSHPDRFQRDPEARREAERRLRRLNAAIAVLRDPKRRALYDALRSGPYRKSDT